MDIIRISGGTVILIKYTRHTNVLIFFDNFNLSVFNLCEARGGEFFGKIFKAGLDRIILKEKYDQRYFNYYKFYVKNLTSNTRNIHGHFPCWPSGSQLATRHAGSRGVTLIRGRYMRLYGCLSSVG